LHYWLLIMQAPMLPLFVVGYPKFASRIVAFSMQTAVQTTELILRPVSLCPLYINTRRTQLSHF